MCIRDRSAFGDLIAQVEAAMPAYTDAEFRGICDALRGGDAVETAHPDLFASVRTFMEKAAPLTLSYAMSNRWLAGGDVTEADRAEIARGKKLAYLLCPARPRLRLVDIETEGTIDEAAAIATLKDYEAVLPEYPMLFAVENARQTATQTLKIAVAAGARLTYDETNTYRADGTTLNAPSEFWNAVRMEDLTSVHFKQKTEAGVLSVVGDGFVDFRAIAKHLRTGNYTGDLLLENRPTERSLQDALESRAYLMAC